MSHAITENTTDDNLNGRGRPIPTLHVSRDDAAAYDAAIIMYNQLAESGETSREELEAAYNRLDQIETAYKANLRGQYEADLAQSELNTDPPPTLAELGELRLASVAAKKELRRCAAIINAPGLGQSITRQFLEAQYAEAIAEARYQRGKRLFRERDPGIAARPSSHRLMARTYQELLQIETPPWRVPLLVPEGGLAVLYGKPKTGKTFWALELSVCVAAGKPFHGLPVKQGRVLYLAAEGGPARLRERVTALLKARGIADLELKEYDETGSDGIDQWLMVSSAIDLCNPTSVEGLLRMNPGQFDLVVIDTLARCMPAGDENSTKDMNAAIGGCDRIREKTGAAVLLIHHEGWKEKRPRGASALFGAVDALLRADMDKVTKIVTVGAEDLRDDEPEPPLSFMLHDSVLTLVETNEPSSKSDRREKMLGILLRLCSEHGEAVPIDQWRAAANADGLLDGKSEHMRRQQFRRAMDWMLKHRMVKLTKNGHVAPTAPTDDFADEE